MKKIEVNGKEFSIKTELDEITINEFNKSVEILQNPEMSHLEHHIFMIETLSDMTIDEIESIELDEIPEIVKSISVNDLSIENSDLLPSITVDGIEYKARIIDGGYKYNVKEIRLLQEAIKKSVFNYSLDLAAIIYKEEGGDLTIESIEKRKSIFGDKITIKQIAPFIMNLSEFFGRQK